MPAYGLPRLRAVKDGMDGLALQVVYHRWETSQAEEALKQWSSSLNISITHPAALDKLSHRERVVTRVPTPPPPPPPPPPPSPEHHHTLHSPPQS
ncbi:hypothetical protein CIRG_06640 [Coccidioides immitis RMSCC 2394]|uniref:Uncharacterized protein n=1 Tax=Coccidioides immitis RMSCC 2394 TaxID=404692 RepID=A0A0J6YIN6_COCIT|nr:hypothetical protein CIRG_06640 [Coccidioides immitis RMSCC 2394]